MPLFCLCVEESYYDAAAWRGAVVFLHGDVLFLCVEESYYDAAAWRRAIMPLLCSCVEIYYLLSPSHILF